MKMLVNLEKLSEARSPMTPGEWALDEDGEISAFDGPNGHHVGPCDLAGHDTTGMLATHNAADVLIEVARTLLVYNAAKHEAARCRERWSRDWDNIHLQHAHNFADRELWSSKAAHEAALAKVSL